MNAAARHVRVVIPYKPREVFVPFHERRQRWSATVAHRRAGKTVARVNDLIRSAGICKKPEPRFAYIAPLYNQAKDIAWSYAKHYTAPIPGIAWNESELRVDFPNNARLRLYGADNPDRLRGLYFDGVVFDEYGDMDPRIWPEIVRPALSDRQGWADFIGTPKGRNHFQKTCEDAKADPGSWYFAELKASQTGILPAAELADARKAMTDDQYDQEYECSFAAAVIGAYFAREFQQAETDRRLGSAPWDPATPVWTAWDLGIGDSTAIWFAQVVGKEVHLIDFIENSGVGLDWYAKELDRRPYKYEEHILPHDAEARELGTGKTRVETLNGLGVRNTRVLKAAKVEDRINASRLLLPRCWFDGAKCKHGIESLRQYRRDWDDKLKVFKNNPLHDWTSHAADAFGYLAQADLQPISQWSKPLKYNNAGIV